MNMPNIAAYENGEWINPLTNTVTHISVNRSMTSTPEYHWIRNPAYSIKREFSPEDELRIAQALLGSSQANARIIRGSFQDMIDASSDVLLAIVDDPDPQVNKKFGGLYYQPDGNMYRIARLEDLLGIFGVSSSTIGGSTTGGNTTGGSTTGGSTNGGSTTNGSTNGGSTTTTTINVGDFGIQVNGFNIILPADGYYQIQHAGNYTEVFQGDGGVSVTVTDGLYNVINLTNGNRTNDVAIGDSTVVDTNTPTNNDGSNLDNSIAVGNHGIRVSGNSIFFPDNQYYQIQRAEDTVTVFESTVTANIAYPIENGTYNVINLTDNLRTDDVVIDGTSGTTDTSNTPVNVGDFGVQVQGLNIILPDDGYYQVQVIVNGEFTEVFQGNGGTTIAASAGTYLVVNLTHNNRTENIVIEG